jgi:hypothetical protein
VIRASEGMVLSVAYSSPLDPYMQSKDFKLALLVGVLALERVRYGLVLEGSRFREPVRGGGKIRDREKDRKMQEYSAISAGLSHL